MITRLRLAERVWGNGFLVPGVWRVNSFRLGNASKILQLSPSGSSLTLSPGASGWTPFLRIRQRPGIVRLCSSSRIRTSARFPVARRTSPICQSADGTEGSLVEEWSRDTFSVLFPGLVFTFEPQVLDSWLQEWGAPTFLSGNLSVDVFYHIQDNHFTSKVKSTLSECGMKCRGEMIDKQVCDALNFVVSKFSI